MTSRERGPPHAEDAVGEDQEVAREARCGLHPGLQVGHVEVPVDGLVPGPGEPDRVDDAVVVEFIAQDDGVGFDEGVTTPMTAA